MFKCLFQSYKLQGGGEGEGGEGGDRVQARGGGEGEEEAATAGFDCDDDMT